MGQDRGGRVAGKVALVTGGGSGLGKADCEALAREGATVVVTDVKLEPAQKVAEAIGNGAVAMVLDVASEEQWIATIKAIEDRFGRLDILVNNAGVVLSADVEGTTLEQFRFVNAVMNEGVFLGCKYAIPLMNRNDGGSIINMSSTGALLGYPIFFAYSAAKGAVRSMTKSIAVMCQEKGYKIRCNSVHPGAIHTPIIDKVLAQSDDPDALYRSFVKSHPIGRLGKPEEIAAICVYLGSDESAFATGAEFRIDGGSTI